MTTDYERPTYDEDAMACGYTSYETPDAGTADAELTSEATGGEPTTAGGKDADDSGPAVEEVQKSQTGGGVPATGAGAEGIERAVWQALYRIEDPEMPVSIVDLGLVYGVDVDPDAGSVDVEMTLTYTGCPAREMILGSVREAVTGVDGIEECSVRLVWSPPWSVEMVTPFGRKALGEFGLSI